MSFRRRTGDAAQIGRLDIAADGIEPAAEGGLLEEHPDEPHDEYGDDGEIGERHGGPSGRDAVAGELAEGLREWRGPEMVLPPEMTKAAPEKMVRVARVATKGRMPTKLTSAPLMSAADEAGEEREAQREPDRIAETEEDGGDDAGKAGDGADGEIEIAHHHDDGHAGGDDHQHRKLLGDVQPVLGGEEGIGQAKLLPMLFISVTKSGCNSMGQRW